MKYKCEECGTDCIYICYEFWDSLYADVRYPVLDHGEYICPNCDDYWKLGMGTIITDEHLEAVRIHEDAYRATMERGVNE